MNAQDYIESGKVLDYSLGLLAGDKKRAFELALDTYPELKKELEDIQSGLENYTRSFSKIPGHANKERIWTVLENILLEKQMDLKKLPLLNKYSNSQSLYEVVRNMLPANVGNKPFMHILTQTETITQVLVMTTTNIPDEGA